ncbi:TetR/AcrR family transcriptional regulator [Cupriavidus sp. HMR-1]|uniref:TetR/AcrR family transcriptional regulator n=1 Tax=Cupriavidus TaxID=106589 RepID=UPI0002A2487E|nr:MULTISPECIES: TetR/AcrR family transcriptional regulator [Cupriavidus]EKZ96292.1 TetR/AcrR family transcriptional regulator [Cupriavidus sp. HMR-1]
MKTSSVREQLLEHASVLMRRRGYNGFSYRDLAELVGVKTSSIHYYFPSKDDLVLEVVHQYRQTSVARLAAIDTSLPLIEQARKYVLPLSNGIDLGQICLIGMLAAEVMVLPQAVRALLQEHFQANENFIADMLRRAEAERGQQYPVPPQLLAKVLYGAIQNGLITARMSGSNDRIDAAANMLIGAVGGSMCAIEEHEAVAA